MNDVTDGLPGDTGCSGPAILAPREAHGHCNYSARKAVTRSNEARYLDGNGAVVDLPAVAGALAALDAALAEHGAPDPERTAAWLGALGAGGQP